MQLSLRYLLVLPDNHNVSKSIVIVQDIIPESDPESQASFPAQLLEEGTDSVCLPSLPANINSRVPFAYK